MANFWDLARSVRDRIYRLHLVKDEPISFAEHYQMVTRDPDSKDPSKYMPAICLVSKQAEEEAAPIYYGENHFAFGRVTAGGDVSSIELFVWRTWPRHLRLVRKVTYQWPKPGTLDAGWYRHRNQSGGAGEAFTEIARFRGLEELYIRVDEEAMIKNMIWSRRTLQAALPRPLTLQDGVAVLRHPGMSGLLKISGVPHVEFLKWLDRNGNYIGGPLSGGFLQSEIAPRLRALKERVPSKRYLYGGSTAMAWFANSQISRSKGSFDFLALPPELRNRVYAMTLKLDGPVHPSNRPPSSVPKGRLNHPRPNSALDILAVSRQIHDEAYGIFYSANVFEFYFPIQVQQFVTNLGSDRLGQIKKVTLHYHNRDSGGVSLAELGLQSLQQLTGLRQLYVLFVLGGLKKYLNVGTFFSVRLANPLRRPGLKKLFDLRGIPDILVRDVDFDEEMEKIKKDKRFPDGFNAGSREAVYVKFERIMAHVNAALAAAQEGRHNKVLLEDDDWHTEEPFPPAAIEMKPATKKAKAKRVSDMEMAQIATEGDEMPINSDNIRDRLRSAKRKTEMQAQGQGQTTQDQTALNQTNSSLPMAQTAVGNDPTDALDPSPPGISGEGTTFPQSVQDALTALGDEQEIDDEEMEDEIVVKHVVRPNPAGGLDGACDEREGAKEEEDVEDSYADREASVEL